MMGDEAAIDGGVEERLPWLEAVDEDEDDGVGIGKLVAGILVALLAIALVIAGIFWLRGGAEESATGELIAAPEESYRVRPEEAGGMEVEGEGDAAFAASEGDSPEGRIDPGAVPEEPVSARPAARREAPARTGSSARIPQSGGRLAESAPRRAAPAQAAAGNGRLVQLGAFSSEAAANRAWSTLSGRYDYLSSLDRSVTPVQSGGRTLYRLRADAGSADAARSICGRLRVASEACSVVD